MNIASTQLRTAQALPKTNLTQLSKKAETASAKSLSITDGTGSDFVDMSLLGATPLVGAVTNFGVGAVAAIDGNYLAGLGSLGGIAANIGGTGAVALGVLKGDGGMVATGAGLLATSGVTAGVATLAANDWFSDTGASAAGMAALGVVPGVGAVTNFATGVTSALNDKYLAGLGSVAGIGSNVLGTAGLVVSLATGDPGGLQASLALLAFSGVTAGVGAIASDL